MIKIVFMGTPDFSTETLEKLNNDKDVDIAYVVTKQDTKSNRGQKVTFSDVKEKALSLDLKILQPEKIKTDIDVIEKIKSCNPDFIIVVAYGQILSKEILDIPKYACINGHASLLPKYRGASPIQSAILNGDKVTGVTTMLMGEGMDTGDILEQTEVMIDKKETSETLFNKLSSVTADLIIHTIKNFDKVYKDRKVQDDNEATKAIIIKKEYGEIDFKKELAIDIDRKIRAYTPWPSAYINILDTQCKIWDIDICDDITNEILYLIYSNLIFENMGVIGDIKSFESKIGFKKDNKSAIKEINYIYKMNENVFVVNKNIYAKCKDDFVKINEIQRSGKKRMNAVDFINGLN